MLHIEVIHSNADEPYRLEDTNGAEFVLKVVQETIPESMFRSVELANFVVETYNNSNAHLSYQNIAGRVQKAMEKFDPEDIAYIFNDLMHVDEQLYYDIVNMMHQAILSKDTCAAGEFARNLRLSTDAEILSIMKEKDVEDETGDCSGECNNCNGSCRRHDQEATVEDRDEYAGQVAQTYAELHTGPDEK